MESSSETHAFSLCFGKILYFRSVDISTKNDISMIFPVGTSVGFLILSPDFDTCGTESLAQSERTIERKEHYFFVEGEDKQLFDFLEMITKVLVFICKVRRQYSRERAAQRSRKERTDLERT